MISVAGRGSTRFGKTSLPTYHDRIPEPRHPEIFNNLLNSLTVDVNSLSFLVSQLTITKRLEVPKKTLREYGQPTIHAIRKPIHYPIANVEEYEINPGLITNLHETAFKGQEDENPMHLFFYHYSTPCDLLGPKDVAKKFVYLKMFRWSLKDEAFAWLKSLPRNCILGRSSLSTLRKNIALQIN
jgi:hypothetical protein